MDGTTYLKFVLALALVLGLIGMITWLVRRSGIGAAWSGRRQAGRRLGIVETIALDNRRRLVLVARDDTGHLVLIGGTSDVLIESGIPLGKPEAALGPVLSRAEAREPKL